MSARERILARLAAAHSARADAGTVDTYLRQHSCGPSPRIDSNLADRFVERAARLATDVERVAALSDVPAACARYLAMHRAPAAVVVWPDLLSLAWREHGISVDARIARGDDVVGITGAFAAIAETGTLMLLSGPTTPASVSLVPDIHIAVVRTGQLVPTMEDAWARLRAASAMPRAVNFVSGPSRTADVEQTVTLGAHGPRRVLILLIDGARDT